MNTEQYLFKSDKNDFAARMAARKVDPSDSDAVLAGFEAITSEIKRSYSNIEYADSIASSEKLLTWLSFVQNANITPTELPTTMAMLMSRLNTTRKNFASYKSVDANSIETIEENVKKFIVTVLATFSDTICEKFKDLSLLGATITPINKEFIATVLGDADLASVPKTQADSTFGIFSPEELKRRMTALMYTASNNLNGEFLDLSSVTTELINSIQLYLTLDGNSGSEAIMPIWLSLKSRSSQHGDLPALIQRGDVVFSIAK